MAKFLVIGASGDIGSCVVRLLNSQSHEVVSCSREASGYDFCLDATDFQAVEEVFQKVGSLDGVVNCAGSLLLKPAHLTSESEWQQTLSASLTTSFAIVRAAGKYMTGGGSVVLLGSAACEIGLANHEAIAAAKAGIVGLARSAAATYAHLGLRFNVVEPGLTETRLTVSLTSNDMLKKGSIAMHPLARLGTPNDIANAIIFFLNPENNWITGQHLAVDGGLSSVKLKPRM